MSYDSEKAAISRIPIDIVIITLDYCDNTFGIAPCTATGEECYNVYGTCKDKINYTETTKDYEFCSNASPLDSKNLHNVRPYLDSFSELPNEIDPAKGLAINAKSTFKFLDDENDPDVMVDPYYDQRSSIQGSFWKKFFARNIYYQGREIVRKRGFHGLPKAEYQTIFKGIITERNGPHDSRCEIVAKDFLKKADTVQIPVATTGKLADPLAIGVTTINLDDASEYESAGYIRINDEIIQYTGKSGDQLTGGIRKSFGTTEAEHEEDTKVQQCAVWEDEDPWEILNDIYQNRIGYDAGDIDITDSEAERDKWLTGYLMTIILSEPKKGGGVIKGIAIQSNSFVWWGTEELKIKFKVIAPVLPTESIASYTETDLVAGNRNVDPNEESRLSRVLVHYDKDPIKSESEEASYLKKYFSIDLDRESSKEFDAEAQETMRASYLESDSAASALANRKRNRFGFPPAKFSFQLEIKDDDVKTGEVIEITSDEFVDKTGTPVNKRFQILRKQPAGKNSVALVGLDTNWTGKRYGVIAPAGFPTYPTATELQRQYAFIGDAGNKVNGGQEDGYHIW